MSLYQPKAIKNYQNFVAKDLEHQFIGINIKQAERIKMPPTSIDIFLNHTLYQLTDRLCVLIYSNQDDNAKRYKARKYSLSEGFIKNYNIINGKNFYDQPTDPDIKRYKK